MRRKTLPPDEDQCLYKDQEGTIFRLHLHPLSLISIPKQSESAPTHLFHLFRHTAHHAA